MPSAQRTRARKIARELADQPPAVLLDTSIETYQRGDSFLAYEILRAAPRALEAATPRRLDLLTADMTSWAHVDCFACFASGVAWRIGTVTDATIAGYARSRDRWRRRAALVSTVPLNTRARGATAPNGDARRTLAICALLVDDRDDMVVKALSWALRELAKRDPASVRSFLEHNADRLASRIRREVTTKLATGRKNPRKRTSSRPPTP